MVPYDDTADVDASDVRERCARAHAHTRFSFELSKARRKAHKILSYRFFRPAPDLPRVAYVLFAA